MKNFSGVCQAAGADKPLRAFFIWITNIVTLHGFLFGPGISQDYHNDAQYEYKGNERPHPCHCVLIMHKEYHRSKDNEQTTYQATETLYVVFRPFFLRGGVVTGNQIVTLADKDDNAHNYKEGSNDNKNNHTNYDLSNAS